MALVKIGTLGLLPPGSLAEVTVGEDSIAVCNVEGEIFAFDGLCPHRQGPIGHGALHGHTVVCPWHAWEFDCRELKQYPVTVQDNDILIEVP